MQNIGVNPYAWNAAAARVPRCLQWFGQKRSGADLVVENGRVR